MKNVNIMGGLLKNPIFRVGELTKNQYIRENCLKRGATWTVCRLRRGLAKKKDSGAFEGRMIPQSTLCE